jgi:hypothetical protein
MRRRPGRRRDSRNRAHQYTEQQPSHECTHVAQPSSIEVKSPQPGRDGALGLRGSSASRQVTTISYPSKRPTANQRSGSSAARHAPPPSLRFGAVSAPPRSASFALNQTGVATHAHTTFGHATRILTCPNSSPPTTTSARCRSRARRASTNGVRRFRPVRQSTRSRFTGRKPPFLRSARTCGTTVD